MEYKAKISEIFTSVQGEGPYIGVKQLFIRFSGCNLKCGYCDTNGEPTGETFEYTAKELRKHLDEFDLKCIHSVSLTGGEPLLWTDFLNEFLPLLSNKIYLETNSTLGTNLEKVIEYIDIISADIKLPSATGIEHSFAAHDEFFKVATKYNKEIFAKIVFDQNILDDEINKCVKLAEKYNLLLVLQPRMVDDDLVPSPDEILEIHGKFLEHHANTRVVPQVHKFMHLQ